MLLTTIFNVLISSFVAIGLVEVIKNFLPDSLNSKVKTIISLVVELIAAAVYVAAFGAGTSVFIKVITVIATVATSQLLYENVVSLLKKLTELISSKLHK